MRYSNRGKLLQQRERVTPLRDQIRAEYQFESNIQHNFTSDSDQRTIVAVEDRYGFPVRLAMSHETGLLYLVDRLAGIDYQRFYKDNTYRNLLNAFWSGEAQTDDKLVAKQDTKSQQQAQKVLSAVSGLLNLPENATMLDIGGSTGSLAQLFSEQFHLQAIVLDPAEAELKLAAERGLQTRSGLFEEVEFAPDQRYDLIVLNQTIEHIYDMKVTFEKIHHLLKPNGYLIFDILDFLAETEQRGTGEAVARLDHPHFLFHEMAETFCQRIGVQLMTSIAYKSVCMLYVCRKAEVQPAAMFPPETRQAIVRYLLNKATTWRETPRVLEYSVTERIQRRLKNLF